MRQIVLDTETTGLDPALGHRIIEIGCVELMNRKSTERRFHRYLQPDREIDAGAFEVHGISQEFLADKPRFRDIAQDLLDFIAAAELIIHNAPFDLGFLDYELNLLGLKPISKTCKVIDTLLLARQKHAGQKNNLDALCKRYHINNTHRQLHGALLDAELLGEVYLAMSGGQASLFDDGHEQLNHFRTQEIKKLSGDRPPLAVISATAAELEQHKNYLDMLQKKSGGKCLWLTLDH